MQPNRFLALAYHDILRDESGCQSGFQSPDADTYKIDAPLFADHLAALESCKQDTPFQVLLTFDDGGNSAPLAADLMERVGRRGYFFITTSYIGKPYFLTTRQIADLHGRGHVIGSHGVTHRGRMSHMRPETLTSEWSESVATLSDITGSPILTASVPSGFYSLRVAKFAAAEGIRQIFTQQPTTRASREQGCEILGRFTPRSWTTAEYVKSLAEGFIRPHMEEAISWRLRRMAKALPGGAYRDIRRIYFERRSSAKSL